MDQTLTRRDFSKALACGLGAAALASSAAAPRNLKFGYAGLSWNVVPKAPEGLDAALRDIASLGFYGFETFAEVLETLDAERALGPMIEKHGLPLFAGYIGTNVVDPAQRSANVEKIIRYGKVIRKYKGTYGVVAAGGVKRSEYNYKDHRADIVASLNDYGKALNDLGLGAGLHQHTGTAIETRDEVYDVMHAVDTRVMKFAPDVGQLQKGGADAAQVIQDFLPIVSHMHLKDYSGGKLFGGYCPLGQGKVDLKRILDMVETEGKKPDVVVELDRAPDTPMSALETAQIAKAYLQSLGYKFRS